MPKNKDGKKVIATNKKAYHDYYVLSTYEAGIQLFGTEVKSIRAGTVNADILSVAQLLESVKKHKSSP